MSACSPTGPPPPPRWPEWRRLPEAAAAPGRDLAGEQWPPGRPLRPPPPEYPAARARPPL
eukprot:1924231-Lingulodinium_polyedra.AAC.1